MGCRHVWTTADWIVGAVGGGAGVREGKKISENEAGTAPVGGDVRCSVKLRGMGGGGGVPLHVKGSG